MAAVPVEATAQSRNDGAKLALYPDTAKKNASHIVAFGKFCLTLSERKRQPVMADTNIFVVGLGIGLDEEGRGLLGWQRVE